jgi:amino acid transporter
LSARTEAAKHLDATGSAGAITKRIGLPSLVAATFFMVSGGPYGIEPIVSDCGYAGAVIVLVLTPLFWSVPTALVIGELATALPASGGYYVWVKRALGPFWGFQEAWLSLVASIFDMAIYPTLFTLYLARMFPALGEGAWPIVLGAAMIAICAAWNLLGARSVGRGAVVMTILLLLPFVALAVAALRFSPVVASPAAVKSGGLWAGVLVAMWNYMGWDNASTIAAEVDRPQRNYPVALLITVALVAGCYVFTVAAVARTGLDPSAWSTGGWVDVGIVLGGKWLSRAIVLGGVICGMGMFNALVLSYSRVPQAMADDRFLPRVFARTDRYGAPWVSVLACAAAYTACLSLGIVRLIELDVLLYGLSLALEFVALVVLRKKEPSLPRPFRVPGGAAVAAALGLLPLMLLGVTLWRGREEKAGALPSVVLGGMLVVAGPLVYFLISKGRSRGWRESSSA